MISFKGLISIFLLFITLSSAALQLVQIGDIPNRYKFYDDPKIKSATTNAIAKLTYANIFVNKQQTIVDCTSGTGSYKVRIDMQGTFYDDKDKTTYHNLQAQVCGVSGSSTTAHLNVAETMMTSIKTEQDGVARAARNGLVTSTNQGKSYKLMGKL
eukprot:gene2445-3019_t